MARKRHKRRTLNRESMTDADLKRVSGGLSRGPLVAWANVVGGAPRLVSVPVAAPAATESSGELGGGQPGAARPSPSFGAALGGGLPGGSGAFGAFAAAQGAGGAAPGAHAAFGGAAARGSGS
jgi:hypothetical protein